MYRFSMTGSARFGVKLVLVLFAVCALIAAALTVIFHSSRFQAWVLAEITQRSGYQVRTDSLGFQWPFTIVANPVE